MKSSREPVKSFFKIFRSKERERESRKKCHDHVTPKPMGVVRNVESIVVSTSSMIAVAVVFEDAADVLPRETDAYVFYFFIFSRFLHSYISSIN